jgi:hypothetical protein
VTQSMRELEERISALRAEVRRAVAGGDRSLASDLRAELRQAERQWDESLARLEAASSSQADGHADTGAVPSDSAALAGGASRGADRGAYRSGALLPVREQVHQALTLLGGPAAPRLVVAVHAAFYADTLASARLTSMRRDEERSFRSAPYARPYYLCAALTADLLAPARGLLAISTWPMDRRIIGLLSPRVDYLIAAIRIAGRFGQLPGASPEARRLLWRFAAHIPHAATSVRTMNPDEVATAAKAELGIHQPADSELRSAAALRARARLDDAEQLFGAGLRMSRQASSSA